MTNLIRCPSFPLNYLVKLLILSELLCLSTQSEVQYIKFFGENNCSDTNLNGEIKDTNTALNITPGLGDAMSIKVNGMWRIYEPRSPGDEIVTEITTKWAVDSCAPKIISRGPYTIAEKFGDSNLKTSEIAFCTERTLWGIRFTVRPGDKELALPRQIMMLSWYFTGLSEWTVFPNTNFTGEVTCLKPQEKVISDGNGITYNWNSRLLVGSVRRGCSSDSSGVSIYTNTNYLFLLLTIVTFFHHA